MNRDFVEMLSALFEAGAEFMVVGAHALAVHGTARATGDLDIWVRASPENGQRVLAALRVFGAPLFDLTLEDLSHPGIVFQMGLPPARIDLLTGIPDSPTTRRGLRGSPRWCQGWWCPSSAAQR